MPYKADVFRIMLSGPGDTTEERAIAAEIIDEWNHQNSYATNIILMPIQWEIDSVPAVGNHPQALLNRQLVNTSDAVVAIFNQRLGSATPRHASGTAEEIAEFSAQGKDVFIYIYGGPVPQRAIDDPQYRNLMAFRDQISQNGLHYQFNDQDQLRKALRAHIGRLTHSLSAKVSPNSSRDADVAEADQFWSDAIGMKTQWEGMARQDSDINRALPYLDQHRQHLLAMAPIVHRQGSEILASEIASQVMEIEALLSEFGGAGRARPRLPTRRRIWISGHSAILRSIEISDCVRNGVATNLLERPTLAEQFRKAGVLSLNIGGSQFLETVEDGWVIELMFFNAGSGPLMVVEVEWGELSSQDRIALHELRIPKGGPFESARVEPVTEAQFYELMDLPVRVVHRDTFGQHETHFALPGLLNLNTATATRVESGRLLERLVSNLDLMPLVPPVSK